LRGLQPLCRNGHPKNADNTYKGRCRLCRRLIARKRRAMGIVEGRPERRKELYWRRREEELDKCRARYHANKKKYCALRRIRRLQRKEYLDENEALHLRELIAEVAAMPTKSPDRTAEGDDRSQAQANRNGLSPKSGPTRGKEKGHAGYSSGSQPYARSQVKRLSVVQGVRR
jgi:hypothetical protein